MKITKHLYPLKFIPILKEKVWGGNKLAQVYNKEDFKNIGESWEISGVQESISIVSNGNLKGTSLNQLIETFKEYLVGKEVYQNFGNTFPLLFKFIDAKEDLSVQLHPNDILAKERHQSFGKTEMWYILDAEKDARLILGFNQEMNETIYKKHLLKNSLTDILHSEKVNKGDSFFIAPGTIHAIGSGVVLAEIQQTSDITYRIFDWDRPSIGGELRELHNDLALEAINFAPIDAKLKYSEKTNTPISLCKSPYFITNKLVLSERIKRDISKIDSFVVYMCVEGEATFKTKGHSEMILKGETILIPSVIKKLRIKTNQATLLEVYMP
ncbi:MAG: mannose-6-phosphate isomerase [Flavobacteriaceae bacterium]|uniref:type I phosphomannose isomerase catalytic subunit n=1 Tax=Candidatus Marifrigoribacter sp. Uisw_064 TaxID=3230970 RepID=UPI003ADDBD79